MANGQWKYIAKHRLEMLQVFGFTVVTDYVKEAEDGEKLKDYQKLDVANEYRVVEV